MKKQETIEEFLARGGQVKQLQPALAPRTYHRTSTHERKLREAVKLAMSHNYSDALALMS